MARSLDELGISGQVAQSYEHSRPAPLGLASPTGSKLRIARCSKVGISGQPISAMIAHQSARPIDRWLPVASAIINETEISIS
jgi:hypothetical protein